MYVSIYVYISRCDVCMCLGMMYVCMCLGVMCVCV